MSDVDRHRILAASFGAAASTYEKGRPGYPPELLDWLVPVDAHEVVDLGAGTGKLSRALVTRGLDVTAVDPSPEMLAVLAEVVPAAHPVVGTAERMPLPAACADLVIAAQSWHWADRAAGSLEVGRVLRPGGRFSLVWNEADTRVEWVARLQRVFGGGSSYGSIDDVAAVSAPFGELERHRVEWSVSMAHDEIVAMVASRSYVISAPADERAEILDRVREIVAELPARVAYPYVTEGFRARRP